MQYKITIPEPCRQPWDKMIPDETGRYCNSCQKSVIDFRSKSDEEIQAFLINNLQEPVCGRFSNTQVHRIVIDLPENIFNISMPLWKRFLVACLFIFGASVFPFETTIAGKSHNEITFYQQDSVTGKSTDQMLQTKKRKKKKKKVVYTIMMETMGMFTIVPIDLSLDTRPDTGFKLFSKEVSYAIDKSPHLATDNKSMPHKEYPGPTPSIPTEFILPSILLFRRKNNSKPMD